MFQPRRPMPPMNRQMNHYMFQQPFGFPPQQMNVQRRGFGGLIQRLLNKGQVNQPTMQGGLFNPFGFQNSSMLQGARSTSTLSNLTNPANLSSILSNVQKTLKTAESIVPMVQQYGPLVKNLPAMWKIYKELKDTPSESEEEQTTESKTKTKLKTADEPSKENKKTESTEKKRSNGESVPKLYI